MWARTEDVRRAHHDDKNEQHHGDVHPGGAVAANIDISQFSTDTSQFSTDISQFSTDISQFSTDISQFHLVTQQPPT